MSGWQFTIRDLLLATALFSMGLATSVAGYRLAIAIGNALCLFPFSHVAAGLFGAAVGAAFHQKAFMAAVFVMAFGGLLTVSIHFFSGLSW